MTMNKYIQIVNLRINSVDEAYHLVMELYLG